MSRRMVLKSVALSAVVLLGSLATLAPSSDAAPRTKRVGRSLGTLQLNGQGSSFADILYTGGAATGQPCRDGWFNVFGGDVAATAGFAGNSCTNTNTVNPPGPLYTLPAPNGTSIVYGANGSSRGISAFSICLPNAVGTPSTENVGIPYGFSGTDTPYLKSPLFTGGSTSADYTAACGRKLAQVPSIAGAVAIVRNANVTLPLRTVTPAQTPPQLQALTVAQICTLFKTGVAPAGSGITKVVYRAAGSGTNLILTNYLDMACSGGYPGGPSTTVLSFPGWISATSSQGVSSAVTANPGSVGYLDGAQAFQDSLNVVALQTKIQAAPGTLYTSPLSSTAIANGLTSLKDIDPNLHRIELDFNTKPTAVNTAYPIVGFSYLWYYETGNTANGAAAIIKHGAYYTYTRTGTCPVNGTDADCIAKAARGYAPLPGNSRTGATNWSNATLAPVCPATPVNTTIPANNVKNAAYSVLCNAIGP